MNTCPELIPMEHLATPEMLIEFAVLIHLKVSNKNHTTLFSLWILISTLHGSWLLPLRWTSIFLYICVCVLLFYCSKNWVYLQPWFWMTCTSTRSTFLLPMCPCYLLQETKFQPHDSHYRGLCEMHIWS